MNKLWKLPIEITSGSEYLNNVSVNQRICGIFFFHFHGPFQATFYEIIFWAGGRREEKETWLATRWSPAATASTPN